MSRILCKFISKKILEFNSAKIFSLFIKLVRDIPSDIKELKFFLKNLKGSKILTLEETTTSQWLFVELKEAVDELIVCDPYRNSLLSEGAKTDKIDAKKLVLLLKANLLKPVYHSTDFFIEVRKLVSAYEDLVKKGVRLKNQKSAALRAVGLEDESQVNSCQTIELFIHKKLDQSIESYEKDKKEYEKEFLNLIKIHPLLRWLKEIPGIGTINSLVIGAAVVDGKRFKNEKHFHSYSGLVRHEKLSGGKSYGFKMPRYRRDLKSAFKTAALSAINHNSRLLQPCIHRPKLSWNLQFLNFSGVLSVIVFSKRILNIPEFSFDFFPKGNPLVPSLVKIVLYEHSWKGRWV